MSDLPEVIVLFKKAIQHMNDNDIHQWDEKYPDEDTIKNDIAAHHLYLYRIDERIASVFVLNRECDVEYTDGNWKNDDASFAVIHRFCVDPDFQQKGIGTRTVLAAETILKNRGLKSIRLDTFSENPVALRLYEKLGYNNVGSAKFRKGTFILFEKSL